MISLVSSKSSTYNHFSSSRSSVLCSHLFLELIQYLDSREKRVIRRVQRLWNFCLLSPQHSSLFEALFSKFAHQKVQGPLDYSAAVSAWISQYGDKMALDNNTQALLANTLQGPFAYINYPYESLEIIRINTWQILTIPFRLLQSSDLPCGRIVDIFSDSTGNAEIMMSNGNIIQYNLSTGKISTLFSFTDPSRWVVTQAQQKGSFLLISFFEKTSIIDQHILLDANHFRHIHTFKKGRCILQTSILFHATSSFITAYHLNNGTETATSSDITKLWRYKLSPIPIDCLEFKRHWLLYTQYIRSARSQCITIIDTNSGEPVIDWTFSFDGLSSLEYHLYDNAFLCIADHTCLFHFLYLERMPLLTIDNPSLVKRINTCDEICRILNSKIFHPKKNANLR